MPKFSKMTDYERGKMCDRLGVTDRYTGFRHNLTRGSRDPVRPGLAGRNPPTPGSKKPCCGDCANKAQFAGPQHQIPLRPAECKPMFAECPPKPSLCQGQLAPPSQPKPTAASPVKSPVSFKPTEGIIEKIHVPHSGVHMKKPAPTATIQEQCGINTRYPGSTEYKDRYVALQRPARTLPFTINPTLDFTVHGRPLDRERNIPKVTEYQYRYSWPDAAKIRSLPWMQSRPS